MLSIWPTMLSNPQSLERTFTGSTNTTSSRSPRRRARGVASAERREAATVSSRPGGRRPEVVSRSKAPTTASVGSAPGAQFAGRLRPQAETAGPNRGALEPVQRARDPLRGYAAGPSRRRTACRARSGNRRSRCTGPANGSPTASTSRARSGPRPAAHRHRRRSAWAATRSAPQSRVAAMMPRIVWLRGLRWYNASRSPRSFVSGGTASPFNAPSSSSMMDDAAAAIDCRPASTPRCQR